MAVDNTILVRRGSGTPSYSDFAQYELAYDYTNDKLYIRDGNAMVEVGSAGGGATGDIEGVTAGTGLSGGGTSGTVTLNIDSTVATLTGSQTLTNKTLTSPTITGDISFNDASTPKLTITDTTNTVSAELRANDTTGTVGTVTDHNFNIIRNGTGKLTFYDAYTMHNNGGNDLDFRAKDDNGTEIFRIDAGTSKIHINSTLLLDSVNISAIQSSGESFANNDTSLMTSAAIEDKILSYGYATQTGDITQVAITVGAGLTGSTTTNSGAHTQTIGLDYLPATDDRDVKPSAITTSGRKQVRAYFTTLEGLTGSSGNDYQDLLVLDTYSDGTGGDMNALAFDKSTHNIYHYLADQSDSTWGTAKRIAYIENGSNNRVMTATDSSTVRGEGNLTFDGSTLAVTGAITTTSTINIAGIATFQSHINMGDSDILRLGSDLDLKIQHTGSHGYITNDTGHLYIRSGADDKQINIQADDGSGGMTDYMRFSGSESLIRVYKNTRFGDTVNAQFGDSADLKIRHDGSNSIIQADGTGDLVIRQDTADKDILLRCDDGSGGIATYITLDGSATQINLHKNTFVTGLSSATEHFQLNFAGTSNSLLKIVNSGWSNETTHDILFNYWSSNIGDYTYLKSAGNSTSGHGIALVGDTLFAVGDTTVATGAVTNSATAPFTDTWFYVNGSGNGVFKGSVTSVGASTTTLNASSTITTNYGVAFTNGNTNFLQYNNATENVLYMRDTTNGAMIQTWGVNSVQIHKGLTINETGGNHDTRIEGDTDTHLFFADASADRVGIGTSSPSHKMHIINTGTQSVLRIDGDGNRGANRYALDVQDDDANNRGTARFRHTGGSGNPALIIAEGYDHSYIFQSKNTSASDAEQFRIEHFDGNVRMNSLRGTLAINEESGQNVGISTSSPSYKLDVAGDARVQDVLYLEGNGDQMLRFSRSGADVVSIEQDSAHLYFYNRTTSKIMFLMSETGSAKLGYNSNPTLELRNTATSAGSGSSLTFGHSQSGNTSVARISSYLTDGSESNRTGHLRFWTTRAGTEELAMQLQSNKYLRLYQQGDTTDYLELYVDDSRAYYHHAHTGTSSAYHRFMTDSGYIELGPANSSWAHINTDRDKFYFSKPITVDGGIITAYNEDLSLQRQQGNSNDSILITDSNIQHKLDGNVKLQINSDGRVNYNGWTGVDHITVRSNGHTNSSNAATFYIKFCTVVVDNSPTNYNGLNLSGTILNGDNNHGNSIDWSVWFNAALDSAQIAHGGYMMSKGAHWISNIFVQRTGGDGEIDNGTCTYELYYDLNQGWVNNFYNVATEVHYPSEGKFTVTWNHDQSEVTSLPGTEVVNMQTNYYDDGNQTLVQSGAVGSPSYSFLASRNTGMYRGAADTIDFTNGGTRMLTIQADGDLELRSDGSSQGAYIQRVGGVQFTWDRDSYGTSNNHAIVCDSDDIKINSFHNVTIQLDSNNNNGTETFQIRKHNTGMTNGTLLFQVDGSGNVDATADVIAYSSSDKRLKDNLKPISNSLEKLQKLTGYEFDWNDKQDTYEGHDVGVVAQEVEDVLPEVVATRDNGYKAVKYEKIVPLLIEAMKEQQQEINKLKEKLNG